jgi:NADH:ubiquinone oxidoreductase subunit 6 (subunit J)
LLYVLVYVGAIVVLIIFVVQLTNTTLSDSSTLSLKDNARMINLIIMLSVAILTAIAIAGSVDNFTNGSMLLLSLSNLSLTNFSHSLAIPPHFVWGGGAGTSHYLMDTVTTASLGNLNVLANSLFNEYAYVLVLSTHAILLAIIGPIKIALTDMINNAHN